MNYQIIEYAERYYAGLSMDLNIRRMQDYDLGKFWSYFMEKAKFKVLSDAFIAKQDYPADFIQSGNFTYAVLAPVKNFDNIPDEFVKVIFPKGKYIHFETEYKDLNSDLYAKVYEFCAKSKKDIAYGCDLEIYPFGFDSKDPKSKVFIGLKMND